MKRKYEGKKVLAAAMILALTVSMAGCGINAAAEENKGEMALDNAGILTETASGSAGGGSTADLSEYFTDRDLEQTADLSEAVVYELKDSEDITITGEGVYVLRGRAADVTVTVEADKEAKVQLVLDGADVSNTDFPVIYVKSADKVFVTTTDSENTLSVTGAFTSDGDTNTDAVIFSKDDLVLNGKGTLTVNSSENGITGKDDLKITGGTLIVNSGADAIEANDGIYAADGTVIINSGKDGLHAEKDDDPTTGRIYIASGSYTIQAEDDAIQGTTTVAIAGGTFSLTAGEAIEGTSVEIGGGSIEIDASDDGINASSKSSSVPTRIVIDGGTITIRMGSGDTDALDSNGDLYINGGSIDITAQSAFDYDGQGQMSGGTVTVNGSQVTQLTNSMMGGGMKGGQDFRGQEGSFQGGQRPGRGGMRGKEQVDQEQESWF